MYLLAALLLLGLALRLYDLTDQPLDFHATRQLRDAIIARSLYYQMSGNTETESYRLAVSFEKSTGQYEPPLLETLVAFTYRLMGGENIWVARIYNSLFWLIGGVMLYILAYRMGVQRALPSVATAGALLASGYYLLLPFAVQGSRSFQPDPGMVMWMLLAVFALYRWSETGSWEWALLTGVLMGIAIFVKVVATYILAGAGLVMTLYRWIGDSKQWTVGSRQGIEDSRQGTGDRGQWAGEGGKVVAMALLAVGPFLVYLAFNRQGQAGDYFESWTVALSHLVLEPSFYLRWFNFIQSLLGLSALLLGLIGMLLYPPRGRALLLGLWLGYGLYGLLLPYQMYTHSYYHLQLVPILALSLAPLGALLWERLSQMEKRWLALATLVMVGGIAFISWQSIYTQAKVDYRNEPVFWQEVAAALPPDRKVVALTQDYGFRLMYYGWRKVNLWPISSEQGLSELRGSHKEFQNIFNRRTAAQDYFLVTDFDQLDSQPELKQLLDEKYPLFASGTGYLIYDLQHPLIGWSLPDVTAP